MKKGAKVNMSTDSLWLSTQLNDYMEQEQKMPLTIYCVEFVERMVWEDKLFIELMKVQCVLQPADIMYEFDYWLNLSPTNC